MPSDGDVSKWLANAVQWDAVWGPDETTCANITSRLSDVLKSSKSHTFKLETARVHDGVVALLPDLHRLLTIGLTADLQLASITIELTCESDLKSYYAKAKSLPRQPIQDPRLQEFLKKLEQGAQRPISEQISTEIGTLQIREPQSKPLPRVQEWPKVKIDALRSIEAAADAAFQEQCVKKERAVITVPDFELYDPTILVMISGNGSCVVPIEFENRQTSPDPYKAYSTHHCVENQELVRKTRPLIRAHQASTKTQMCRE
jgi:hypothetical protein